MRQFADAVGYYSRVSSSLGVRFYREMERSLREVCSDPQRFQIFDPPARRSFSRSFPYAIIFVDRPGYVWIVAVMHLKRRPGYWHHRIE